MKKIYILLIVFILAVIADRGFSQTRIDKNSLLAEDEISSVQITPEEIEVATYPNPASKSLTFSIKGIDFSKVEIEIFELTGQPVMTLHPDNIQFTIDVSSFKEGMYFYKVISSEKVVKSEKFIIVKK